jgi:hypothetical protein
MAELGKRSVRMADFLKTGPADAVIRVLLAHGAGAPMDSSFMTAIAEGLAGRGIACWRFEFAYMAGRREGGKKRPAPKAETLIDAYGEAARAAKHDGIVLAAGKSMGGRIATMAADALFADGAIAGAAALGYPFRAAGQRELTRTAHLEALIAPTLIIQGERDPLGARAEVETLKLSPTVRFAWIGDGDHDFGPRGGSRFTRKANLAAACDALASFARDLMRS